MIFIQYLFSFKLLTNILGWISTVAVFLLLQTGFAMGITQIMPIDSDERRIAYIGAIVMASICVAIFWNTFILRKEKLYGFYAHRKSFLFAFLCGVGSSGFAVSIGAILHFIRLEDQSTPQVSGMTLSFAKAIAAALHEEIIFRHIMMTATLQLFASIPVAQLLQTIFFVYLHPHSNPVLIASAALLLGQIYILTKSFIVPAALHFGFNFTQAVFQSGMFGFSIFILEENINRDYFVAFFNVICIASIHFYNFDRPSGKVT